MIEPWFVAGDAVVECQTGRRWVVESSGPYGMWVWRRGPDGKPERMATHFDGWALVKGATA